MDKESLEQLLAQGMSVAEIGKRFGIDPSTVSDWMARHQLSAGTRAMPGGIEDETLVALIAAGGTIRGMAVELGVSPVTVRRAMQRLGLRTLNTRGRVPSEDVRAATAMGVAAITKVCIHHGETEFCLEGRGYYRCKRCRSGAVARRRRKVKAILVEEAGGACSICGYSRHVGALEFHHLDPDAKRLGLAAQGVSRALDTLRAEARKCVLLCSNCHVEVEAGVASLPIQ